MRIDIDLDPEYRLYGDLKQLETANCPGVACGPTLVVNSMVYLQRRFPDHPSAGKLIPDANRNEKLDKPDMVAAANVLARLHRSGDGRRSRRLRLER